MIAYMVLTPVVAVVVSFASCRLRLCENNIGIAPSQQYSKAVFRCGKVAYLRRNRRLGNGLEYFLDFLVGRERDIVDTWEVGKSRSVWPLGGLSGLSQAVVV